ncbi:hypothetical protein Ahy_B02g057392 isoform D [Arachis hypogaea]|uniref:CAAX prenyl protease 1 homolog n=1 Tax=Arachis hypogaea TaxID=3818 RepID=A0A445ABN6_ARAHY|nr:hypothetical protein Ahy_B02g057392 isoform D [Arachis hypogaea]
MTKVEWLCKHDSQEDSMLLFLSCIQPLVGEGLVAFVVITDLPFSLYSTFVIEARHGFNKQTIWLFFRDMIKGMLIAIVIGPPIVAAIIVIVQKGSPYLAIYLWGFMLVLSLVMMTIYPVLIAPLFNKFTPLPDGTLREKIEKLAASLKFPLKKLFVVDGSTRSSHSNAYMYGFFKNKRIVLYDTLIQQCKNDDEVVAVIAHELGHWKLNHTVYSFVAVQHTVIPIQHLVSFGLNLVSRSFEFQADAFAKKLGYAAELRAGLVKLQEENLSAMNTDPWYSAYHYSHPPLVERESEEQLKLTTTTHRNVMVDEEGEFAGTICSICYEDLKPVSEDLQSISICGHQWFGYCSRVKKHTCPVCKQNCRVSDACRLYFQSVGDVVESVMHRKPFDSEEDSGVLRKEVNRLELEKKGKEIEQLTKGDTSAMAFPYMEAVVGFMIFMYFFETYLDIRQYKALKLPTLPKTLEGVISQDKFLKSRAYSLDKRYFLFVQKFVKVVMDSTILYFWVLPWFWKKSEHLMTFVGLNAENEILHTLGFLAGVMLWSQQTIWLFFRDMIKGMLIAIVIGPPIVAAVIVMVQKGSPYLAIYLWGFILVLSLVMMTIYPVLIAPLFNKFTPLPEGTLREKIEKLAASLKFPLKKLFVVDGSTRSSHSNAYMYGFFKNKRIVLYDTLIQQYKNDDEVVAVIAHELGHWKLNHTVYGFVLFQHTVIPIQHLVSFGLNLVSRSFEFQADAFAKKLGYAAELRDALVKLQEENLSAMNTDPWYSAYHYSHPPLVERLAAIDKSDKKEK